MGKYKNWYITSVSIWLLNMIFAFNLESIAYIDGSTNRTIILLGSTLVFLLGVFSIYSGIKSTKSKNKLAIGTTIFITMSTLFLFAFNFLLFVVYFIGK